MYVTPKVKEQFVWKFSSLLGILDLKRAALGVLIWLLKPGVHFPPECDPRQLHPLLYESFFFFTGKEKHKTLKSLLRFVCMVHATRISVFFVSKSTLMN